MAIVRLPPFPAIRDVVKLYRLTAIKQLSQNFLMDEQLTDKIVKCSGNLCNSQVLEIGPGPGAITRSIIKKRPCHLVLVEKDKRFKPSLEMMKVACSEVIDVIDLIFDDIMDVNLANIFREKSKREWTDVSPNIYFIGNLPFSISTALIIKWLQNISERNGAWSYGRIQMTLTFQKEVAERLIAEAGGDQRCRLSVITQAWTIPKLRFIIPASAFVPKPEVDVAVVSFTPLKRPRTHHKFEFFEKINRHLFSFRQKYSIRCAETLFPLDCREHLSSAMYKLANLDPNIRAFELQVEDVSRLASAYEYLCKQYPEILNYNYRASRKVLSRKLTKSVRIDTTPELLAESVSSFCNTKTNRKE